VQLADDIVSLFDGDIGGDVIICQCHVGSVDIRTGEPIDPPCVIPLERYETRVGEDGYIYIIVDE